MRRPKDGRPRVACRQREGQHRATRRPDADSKNMDSCVNSAAMDEEVACRQREGQHRANRRPALIVRGENLERELSGRDQMLIVRGENLERELSGQEQRAWR